MEKLETACYLAPMEGLTGYVFRNAYHEVFPDMDKYYTPFISPTQVSLFSHRELNEVLPENNKIKKLVPQILTSDAGLFIRTASELKAMGYKEVNLNLGCPSKTVTVKGKGSGMLADTYRLSRFLDEIYSAADVDISIKTRIGIYDEAEWADILSVFEQFPVYELIVHPRLQQDYYKGQPHMEAFALAEKNCKFPLCYNGDIKIPQDAQNILKTYSNTNALMMGRGILENPGLIKQMKGQGVAEKPELIHFHRCLCEGYKKQMSADKDVLFRMKELWSYMILGFKDSQKYMKKIKKAQHMDEYEAAVNGIFSSCELVNS